MRKGSDEKNIKKLANVRQKTESIKIKRQTK